MKAFEKSIKTIESQGEEYGKQVLKSNAIINKYIMMLKMTSQNI